MAMVLVMAAETDTATVCSIYICANRKAGERNAAALKKRKRKTGRRRSLKKKKKMKQKKMKQKKKKKKKKKKRAFLFPVLRGAMAFVSCLRDFLCFFILCSSWALLLRLGGEKKLQTQRNPPLP
jgi:hypothetical protein